jgi:hypothetical protein
MERNFFILKPLMRRGSSKNSISPKKTCNKAKLLFIFAPLCGSSSVGRAPAFQAGCREFEPRLPLLEPEHLFGLFYFLGVSRAPLHCARVALSTSIF